MKNQLKKLILIATSIFSTFVFAEGAFDGINAQVGIGFANLSSENKWSGLYKYGEKGALGNISVGYSHQLNNQFNVATNIFYAFGSEKSGAALGSPSYYSQLKTKNIWGVVIEPGYYFSESSLGYLKLGYARASSEYSDSGSKSGYGNTGGALYGFGFKQMIQDNVYLGAEAYQINFSRSDYVYNSWWGESTNNKPSITYGGVLLGYNFGSNYQYKPSNNSALGAFNGFDVRLGLGFAEKSSKSVWVEDNDPYNISDKGASGNIAFGYSHKLNNQLNLAANIFYNFGSDDAGQWSSSNYTWKTKDIWGVSLEPGYYFTDNSLGYFKFGYARASSEYIHPPSSSADFGSTDGFLYGIGFKHLLTNNLYLGLETYQINFSTNTVVSQADAVISNKPAYTYGGAIVGYTF